MVKIEIEGVPRTFPGQIASFATAGDGNTFNAPNIGTDIVGQGYPNATPIQVPPGSASGAVVNTSLNPYQGIFSRHNTPDNPAEQGGKVIMDLVNGVYTPRIQFTPPEIQP
jgi:hypothetical protein